MEGRHKHDLHSRFKPTVPITVLDIQDDYVYRDPVLMALIHAKYAERGVHVLPKGES